MFTPRSSSLRPRNSSRGIAAPLCGATLMQYPAHSAGTLLVLVLSFVVLIVALVMTTIRPSPRQQFILDLCDRLARSFPSEKDKPHDAPPGMSDDQTYDIRAHRRAS